MGAYTKVEKDISCLTKNNIGKIVLDCEVLHTFDGSDVRTIRPVNGSRKVEMVCYEIRDGVLYELAEKP